MTCGVLMNAHRVFDSGWLLEALEKHTVSSEEWQPFCEVLSIMRRILLGLNGLYQ